MLHNALHIQSNNYNASTNTPALATTTGYNDNIFQVTTQGIQSINGVSSFCGVGDEVIVSNAVSQFYVVLPVQYNAATGAVGVLAVTIAQLQQIGRIITISVAGTQTINGVSTAMVVGQAWEYNGVSWLNIANPSWQPALGYTPVQQGGGTGQQANKLYMGWGTNSRIKVQVDTTDQGNLVTDSYLNNGTLPASFKGALSLVGSGSMYVAGAGDVNGYGFVATTPNGVYAPNGNSQLGALTMQQRSVANLGISYPNIPNATSYTMGFGWDGSHVRGIVDNNPTATFVLANFKGNPIVSSNAQNASNTTISPSVSFTAPNPGVLLAIGNTNYGSLAPDNNSSILYINGVSLANDNTNMTRALVATTTCGAGAVSASLTAASTSAFTAYITLVFIPYL